MTKTAKTFKIGEYAKGGVITVEIQDKLVTVIGKEWDFSTGSRRSSNQTNAKEFTRYSVLTTENNGKRKCLDNLEDLTTAYYAGVIMKWIESKVKFENEMSWW